MRLTHTLQHIDIVYLEFIVCHQEMVFTEALSQSIQVSKDVSLTDLNNAVQSHIDSQELPPAFEV